MKKGLCLIVALLMTFAAALSCAQSVSTHIYGGSERDWLTDIAVSDDGYIALTGWTESSDGTLESRTKKGRSGWLMVIDDAGKEIVNFCTRLGNHDHLSDPVFHADGTLTVMLFAEDANVGWVKHELLRMDMNGEVLSREVVSVKGADEEHFINLVGHDDRGYLFNEVRYGDGGYSFYEYVGYNGGPLRRIQGWHQPCAVADAHVVRLDREGGEDMFLYARDAQGNENPLCRVFSLREDHKRPMMLSGFLSLEDGGAAAAGWVLEENAGEEERIGLFIRWDAQGNVVSEMRTPGWAYGDLALRPGGFAATAQPWDEGGWTDDSIWMIYLLDPDGVMQGTIPLASNAVGTGYNACISALSDGTIVAAHVAPENGEDTVVTVVKP